MMNNEKNHDTFGYWLSGFVDGEGCFDVSKKVCKKLSPTIYPRFVIRLRRDDIGILERIKEYLGCGKIYLVKNISKDGYKRGAAAQYTVFRVEDTHNILVPHFKRYPLYSKKKYDFEIWKEIVHLVFHKAHRHGQLDYVNHLCMQLSAVKKYDYRKEDIRYKKRAEPDLFENS
jgi:hypothetical protein